jgi:hypothetical protein
MRNIFALNDMRRYGSGWNSPRCGIQTALWQGGRPDYRIFIGFSQPARHAWCSLTRYVTDGQREGEPAPEELETENFELKRME